MVSLTFTQDSMRCSSLLQKGFEKEKKKKSGMCGISQKAYVLDIQNLNQVLIFLSFIDKKNKELMRE